MEFARETISAQYIRVGDFYDNKQVLRTVQNYSTIKDVPQTALFFASMNIKLLNETDQITIFRPIYNFCSLGYNMAE